MKKTVHDLDYLVFETREPGEDYSDLRDACYSFWRESWAQTFKELGVNKKCYSDDFLDRELGGVFYQGEPVGFLLYNWFDLSRPLIWDHSYFRDYPKGVLPKIMEAGHRRVMIISYMTLRPDWRFKNTDVSVSEMLIGFAVRRFLISNATALLGYFRNEKRTNEMFYRCGGVPVLEHATAYNVEVDYAYISKESAKDSDDVAVAEAVAALWGRWLKINKKREAA